LHENPLPKPIVRRATCQQRPSARRPEARSEGYGYARVSTGGQTVDAQARQFSAASAANVFSEVASGAKTDRPQLARLVSELAAGDVLMVTRLDRRARSTRYLLNTLAAGRAIPY
jgi:predicted site-specific integrase-resolvase